MNRPQPLNTRSQLALQSYLDALLQDAASELEAAETFVVEPAASCFLLALRMRLWMILPRRCWRRRCAMRVVSRKPRRRSCLCLRRMATPLKSELGLPSLFAPVLLPVVESPVVTEAVPAVVEPVAAPASPSGCMPLSRRLFLQPRLRGRSVRAGPMNPSSACCLMWRVLLWPCR